MFLVSGRLKWARKMSGSRLKKKKSGRRWNVLRTGFWIPEEALHAYPDVATFTIVLNWAGGGKCRPLLGPHNLSAGRPPGSDSKEFFYKEKQPLNSFCPLDMSLDSYACFNDLLSVILKSFYICNIISYIIVLSWFIYIFFCLVYFFIAMFLEHF